MVHSYPFFYLLSDLNPDTDTTHGLRDFLSHVVAEVQYGYICTELIPMPTGYSLWEVYVDNDKITTMPTRSTDGKVFPYLGFGTHFLPALGDVAIWDNLDIEVVPAEESWSWYLNSKHFQNCTLTMKPVRNESPVAVSVAPDCSESIWDGIYLNDVPVTDGDLQCEDHGIVVTLECKSTEEAVFNGRWEALNKAVSIQLPTVFLGEEWSQYMERGEMTVEKEDEAVTVSIAGHHIKLYKSGGIVANALIEEVTAAEAFLEKAHVRKSFFKYMADTSYDIEVSGAKALREPINEENGLLVYRIYVQDDKGITKYKVARTLDCEACGEDGTPKSITEADEAGAAFRVGINKPDAGCEPVVIIFKKRD